MEWLKETIEKLRAERDRIGHAITVLEAVAGGGDAEPVTASEVVAAQAGTVARKPRKQKAGEGEKKQGRPLAEREGQLARKRWNMVVGELQKLIEDEESGETVLAGRSIAEMSELVLGIIGAAPANPTHDPDDLQSSDAEDFFLEYDRLAKVDEGEVFRVLWRRECQGRLSEVLQFSTGYMRKEAPNEEERAMVSLLVSAALCWFLGNLLEKKEWW